ncbi:multidrug effflux MFS transporter [Sneathiella limimaris]|uniref:multidrug effflux MFS transporter n=1 Tax=Sneathiella limimaris TaxID=1964213 RepID=UPI00146D1D71|nr:multidrug effflux MFS transporter [Sneathiella limimaris]
MRYLGKNSIWFTVFLSSAVALGPLATDMYLPTFPVLETLFSVSVSKVQWTLSVFMIGLACFQLIVGPLSDRFGRKPVLFIGLLIFVASSYAAAQATSIEGLTIARFFQSIGVCTGVVIPRAMIRDLFEREMAARKLSRMGSIMGLAPAIAPVIGGYVAVHTGWPGIFLLLMIYGVLVLILSTLLIEESLKNKDHKAIHPAHILRNYSDLLSSWPFMGYALTCAFCFSGFFAFISVSSHVLVSVMNVPIEQFGYYFGCVVVGYISGTLLGPILTSRFGLDTALLLGTIASLLGAFLLCLFFYVDFQVPLAIILPMILYDVGVGIVMPQSQAAAIHPFPEKAGAASALSGFLLLGLASLTGFLTAHFFTGSAFSLTVAVSVMGLMAFVICRLASRKVVKRAVE